MKHRLNVGIIGFGLSGRYFFAPYISENSQYHLAAIVSSQKKIINKEYPKTKVYATVNDLLHDSSIDVVVVASPNPTHFEYARLALEAGKHVILEKPFTNSTAEADQLIAITQQSGKVLAPFHNRRWDTDFLTIRTLLEYDRLGEVLEFESHFDRFRPAGDRVEWKNTPAPGSGVLFDLGPHLIDQALVLFGKPESVYANLQIRRENGKVIDNFDVHLYYPKLKVILKAGVFVKEPGPRLIVHGRKGSFVKYGLDPQEDRLRKGQKPKHTLGDDPEEQWGILNIVDDEGRTIREVVPSVPGNYMAYFDNVYKTITGKSQLNVTPAQARMVIAVIEAAYESMRLKQVIDFN